MACIPQSALVDITYDCAKTTGGIKRLFLGYGTGDGDTIGGVREISGLSIDTSAGSATYGQITVTTPTTSDPVFVEINFNKKDGVSYFGDVLTTEQNGIQNTIPTVMVEIPLMSADNMSAISAMALSDDLVALVETAAGTLHMVGYDFGLRLGTADGNSGTGRQEKNRYQLTLTGEEGGLAYQFTDVDDFNAVAAL
jgi:hypothetical protein